MDLVAAAFGADVDHRSHRVAHRRIEGGGLHLELADGGLGRRERHANVGGVGKGIRHAVDGEFVAVRTAAVGRELRGRVIERRLAQTHIRGIGGPRREQRELHGIARK